MGDEIEKQNRMLNELDTAVDHTANTIQEERETLQRHTKKKNKNCSMYMCCIILILIVIIVILNILRSAFSYSVFITNKSCIKGNQRSTN